MSGFVGVVHITKDGEARVVRVAQSESTGQPSVARSACHLHIANHAHRVFAFQLDVHHVLLLFGIITQKLAFVGGFVKHTHILHREVWQVFEHHLVVALEEVGTVEQQIVNLASVHGDFAIVLEFHSGHLTDKVVEHRTVGNVECIGIEHHRVAFPDELHFRSLYHHLVEALVVSNMFLHVVPRCIEVSDARHKFNVEIDKTWVVAFLLGLDDILLR
ncbi:MAG: hypothetical protein KAZ28_04390 [Bacteroidaceae bacterium]|nr:hypothetical protein [Bacteroidaceae bacterium]